MKWVVSMRERHHLQVERSRSTDFTGRRERISVITSTGRFAITGFACIRGIDSYFLLLLGFASGEIYEDSVSPNANPVTALYHKPRFFFFFTIISKFIFYIPN